MRRRKLLSVILALSLCLTLPLGMAAAEETGTVKEVTSSQELTEALEGTAETVRLGANIEISESLTVRRTVTLDLNGCVLKMTNNGGSVIKVDSGGNLKLTDSDTTAAHKFTPDANGLWALDETAGTKTVTGGVITGGTGTNGPNGIRGGGGVYVAEGGKFTMNGGNIAGYTVRASKGLALGGGVYVAKDGEFTMTDGSIAGCTAQATSDDSGYAWGGGIRSEGTTTLSGRAEIRDCHAKGDSSRAGGGISNGNGHLTISGNVTITGCAADGQSDAVFLFYGGSISGGTFDGSVMNYGSISAGTFNGAVTNGDTGSITGGTFEGSVENYGKITGGTFNGTVANSGSKATVVASVKNPGEFLAALEKPYVTTIKLTDHIMVGATEDVKELTIDRAITLVNGSTDNSRALQLQLPLTIAEGGALTLDGLEGFVNLYPYNGMVVNASGTVTTQPAGENTLPGELSLGQGATLTASGKLVNNGRFYVSDMENLKKAADIGGELTLDSMTIDEDYTLDMKGDLLTICGSLNFTKGANLTVRNAIKVDASGVWISGGSYYCPVTAGGNEGGITGGSFYGPVTVIGPAGSPSPAEVSGGTFYDKLNGNYFINGRKVTYMDGENVYAIQVVGGKASAPDAPSKDGYHLTGWYTEAGEKFDFEKDTVEKDITLTARWSKNAPGVSYASLRFETGGGSAAVYAGWNPFTDAGSGDWYYEDALYVYNRGLMEGTGEHSFSPDGAVTREQLAAFLYREVQRQGGGFTGMWYFPLNYPDMEELGAFADEAMHWCVMTGVLQGTADGRLAPKDTADRAQLSAILHRYLTVEK